MRTYTTTHTVYTFDELSEEQQQNAIENLYGINVEHGWWDCTYEDAERVGLRITSFDLGRAQSIEGEFTSDSEDVAKLIIAEHGDTCETYKTAQEYLVTLTREATQLCQDEADEFCISFSYDDGVFDIHDTDEYEWHDIKSEFSWEFLHALLEDYRIILSKEYDYLTGEDAIRETIEAKEYEFTEDGLLA